jgi:hypothetical protein
MRYKLGRFLQLVGLILLPVAIAGNIAPDAPLSLWRSLGLSGAGVAVFALGWFLQNTGRTS